MFLDINNWGNCCDIYRGCHGDHVNQISLETKNRTLRAFIPLDKLHSYENTNERGVEISSRRKERSGQRRVGQVWSRVS